MAGWEGIWPVAPTPFLGDGRLDLDGMRRVLDCTIDQGATGICILANFSEQFLLSDEERETLTRLSLDHVAGRVPVIVTISHFATQIAVERAARAKAQGALGERFSLRIVHGRNHFLIMPKNVSRTSAAQYVLGLDSMGKLPCRAAAQDAQAATVAAHDAMPPPVLASPIQGPTMRDVPDPAPAPIGTGSLGS